MVVGGMAAFSLLVLCAVIPLAIAALVFFVEILAAIFSRKDEDHFRGKRPPIVVLIPAHNEGRGILPTLTDIKSQIRESDRLVVIADNCTDDTAQIAKAAGAWVIERVDPDRLGKGYALEFGLRSLQATDPEIVIFIDADCRLGESLIDNLAQTCSSSGRPVQALYLMSAPEQVGLNYSISEFAWRIRNDLRPRGLWALGLPCQLMGSGMAFKRAHLSRIKVATGHLTEDLDLGLQLAAVGHAALFCPSAVVRSVFPTTEAASIAQRQRWAHGHLSIIGRKVLPSFWMALRDRNWALLTLSLDAAIPPLVLFVLLSLLVFCAGGGVWLLGAGAAPMIVAVMTLCLVGSGLCFAWIICGRDLLTLRSLFSLIPYVTSKVKIYSRVFDPNKKWVRTRRAESDQL